MNGDDTSHTPAADPDIYPLDDATIAIFAEGTKTIELTNAQMSGALRLFLRQHKLEGQWGLAENGKEIQRRADPKPALAQA